jgi:flagellar assembly protein FliH
MNGMTAWERWELASFDGEILIEKKPDEATTSAPPTAEELDRLCAQARKEGYEAGRQAGYAAGQVLAREEAARLVRMADGLEQALAEFDQAVADELLALTVEIARQVVRLEIAARPDVILRVVHDALAQLPHQHATIYLHPDDAALVRSYMGDALSHAGHRILEEPTLKPGDCMLESGSSQIDASLATRWRRVVEGLGLDVAWDEQQKP